MDKRGIRWLDKLKSKEKSQAFWHVLKRCGTRRSSKSGYFGDRACGAARSCDGGLPLTPVLFRNTRNLKNLLESGRLYDGSRFAFEPSREDRRKVKGASSVLVVRVEAATRGTSNLQTLLPRRCSRFLHSLLWPEGQRFTPRTFLAAPTADMVNLDHCKARADDEIGDNLGFLPAAIIAYTGDGSDRAMTITGSSPLPPRLRVISPTDLSTCPCLHDVQTLQKSRIM